MENIEEFQIFLKY